MGWHCRFALTTIVRLTTKRRLPALGRPRRRRIRKPIEQPVEVRKEPRPRPARAPYVLTLSSRRIARRTLPAAVVPYLRMSGRWLEEHGFAIGSGVARGSRTWTFDIDQWQRRAAEVRLRLGGRANLAPTLDIAIERASGSVGRMGV